MFWSILVGERLSLLSAFEYYTMTCLRGEPSKYVSNVYEVERLGKRMLSRPRIARIT